ncbi:HupE/UreJ family protein [Lacihabitans sp. LS3-19]|uniref:HupE/UreJ family protein n=1 Tax=Lacihabitans sp. LS3-19 TaxID=2487335 RepID=UPI0020CC8809|nr:HupE/UreJ family protein [Lacihabitans sp. LS3-19]
MDVFFTYFLLGYQHITDLAGYDHILFIIALCAIYQISDWRSVLAVITFFTVGHSITLALSVLKILNIDSNLIEFLIPVTILFTCVSNLFYKIPESFLDKTPKPYLRYFFTLFFGLIHGLGFSNYLKSLLGQSTNIVGELFSFNIGIEIGQIVIVSLFLMLSYIIVEFFKRKKTDLNFVLSGFVAGFTLQLIIEKWIF